jgi:hypothetical protein
MNNFVRVVIAIGVCAIIGTYSCVLLGGAAQAFEWMTPLCPVDSRGRYVTFCTSQCRTHDGRLLMGLFNPKYAEYALPGSEVTWDY